jgi:hypothetical protein
MVAYTVPARRPPWSSTLFQTSRSCLPGRTPQACTSGGSCKILCSAQQKDRCSRIARARAPFLKVYSDRNLVPPTRSGTQRLPAVVARGRQRLRARNHQSVSCSDYRALAYAPTPEIDHPRNRSQRNCRIVTHEQNGAPTCCNTSRHLQSNITNNRRSRDCLRTITPFLTRGTCKCDLTHNVARVRCGRKRVVLVRPKKHLVCLNQHSRVRTTSHTNTHAQIYAHTHKHTNTRAQL